MLTALLFGAIASSAFVVGVLIGLFTSPSRRVVAAVLAFGGGVLVSALTFDLIEEAFETGTTPYVIGGFLVGALIYVAVASVLDRMAAQSPKREGRNSEDVVPNAPRIPETKAAATVSGMALLAGAILDGIPENAAIGISLHAEGQQLGIVLLAAVFLANLPESISSTVGFREEGRSNAWIVGIWAVAGVACMLATVVGYALLGGLPPNLIGAALALAAGGILAMLADTVFPEAFENGGPVVALATAVGFSCALLLAQATGA